MVVLIILGIGIIVDLIVLALIWRLAYRNFYSDENQKTKDIPTLESSIEDSLHSYNGWIWFSLVAWWLTVPLFMLWMIYILIVKVKEKIKPWSAKHMQSYYEKRNAEKLI